MQKSPYAVIAAILIVFAVVEFLQKNSPGTSGGGNLPGAVTAGDRSLAVPPVAQEDGIAVYFSPNGGCEDAIVSEINGARRMIDMQAYYFTSSPITRALVAAQQRGVKVRAIIDHTASTERGSRVAELAQGGIPTWTDGDHPIAHNKIIIIDGQTIITGSFNFTHQAEHENAENLVILTAKPQLAQAYESNFEHHLSHSLVFGSDRH